ncbi:hypothetical protein HQ545_06735 [Candidatus Woesearchaeota archaeon]|nr:hypothetical protein [Candidatus Woesearchaeota archaeon]
MSKKRVYNTDSQQTPEIAQKGLFWVEKRNYCELEKISINYTETYLHNTSKPEKIRQHSIILLELEKKETGLYDCELTIKIDGKHLGYNPGTMKQMDLDTRVGREMLTDRVSDASIMTPCKMYDEEKNNLYELLTEQITRRVNVKFENTKKKKKKTYSRKKSCRKT